MQEAWTRLVKQHPPRSSQDTAEGLFPVLSSLSAARVTGTYLGGQRWVDAHGQGGDGLRRGSK